MKQYEPAAASAVVGIAAFQLWQAWNANAPSLAEAREAPPGDTSVKQKLIDADLLVGGLAVIIGTVISVMTRDITALIIMLVVFGSVSLWHHSVLAAEAR